MNKLLGFGRTVSGKGAARDGYQSLPQAEITTDARETQTSPLWGLIPRQDILLWLIEASEEDARWVLESLVGPRGSLLREILKVIRTPNSARSHCANGTTARSETCKQEMHAFNKAVPAEEPFFSRSVSGSDSSAVVQFSTSQYFCCEDDDFVSLDVLRIGACLDMQSEVRYTTRDESAKAGDKYVASEGKLIFMPGVNMQQIRIPIIDNDTWDAALEFGVQLEPADLHNAVLGKYLWQTNVKIIDNDCFPNNRFQEQIEKGDFKSISRPMLLWQYFMMNYRDPQVRIGTIKRLACDQLHNMYLLFILLLNVYLVDYVLNPDVEENSLLIIHHRPAQLFGIMCSMILPFAVLHFFDYAKHGWGLSGTSRGCLQKNLLRKFLNYNEESRESLRNGDLIMAMTRDSTELVDLGYMNLFNLGLAFGQLLAILLYTLLAPLVFQKPLRLVSILPLITFPVILSIFVRFRSNLSTEKRDLQQDMQNDLVNHVNDTVTHYRLIADFNQRSSFIVKMESRISKFNMARRHAHRYGVNNGYVAHWLSTVLVAGYIVYGGKQVMADQLSLGMFLADVRIFTLIGTAFADIYEKMLEMQLVFPALERIVRLMNLQIDTQMRMALAREHHDMTTEKREDVLKKMSQETKLSPKDRPPPIDQLCITLTEMNWSYNSVCMATRAERRTYVQHSGKLEVQQGSLVSLIGKRGEGKSTVLKLLGGVLLADSTTGKVFVPSHLRRLHVSPTNEFFPGTLLDNLTFGVSPGDPDSRLDRVLNICKILNLGAEVGQLVQGNEVHHWREKLSLTQCHLLVLARALISNPEILCLHKPTLVYDDKMSEHVLSVLRRFCKERGIEQDPGKIHLRRPRTCIITTARQMGVQMSDLVFSVSVESGIQMVAPADVTADMMG